MKLVTVRDLRGRSAEVWRMLARERELVVTSNGRPVAVLSSVTPDDLEESLAAIRRARAVQAVAKLQELSLSRFPSGLPGRTVDREIAAVRRKRTR